MKTFIAAVAALCVSTTWSTLASAQQWDRWGGGSDSSSAQVYPDDRYGDQDDDRSYDDNRDRGPRVYNRLDDNDDRRYDPRYNGRPDYSDRRYERYDERRYFETLASDVRTLVTRGDPIAAAASKAAASERSHWSLFDDYNARNATAAFSEIEWE